MTTNLEEIENLVQFQEEITNLEDGEFVYRGQKDQEWSVESSAYRLLSKNKKGEPSSGELIKYHEGLIDNAKNYDETSKIKSDLELLAHLQHQGGATNLIDFSHSALIALWFACQDSTKDGKVFCLDTADVNAFLVISAQDKKESTEKILTLDLRGSKNIKTAKWQPPFSSNRIVKQDSVFIFNKSGKIDDIDFDKVLIILKGYKATILKDLGKLAGINKARIFPDLDGFLQSNAYDKPYEEKTAEEFFKRALDHHLAGRLKEAIADYNQAIDLKSNFSEAYNNRGIAKANLKDFKGAIKDFDLAIDFNPDSAEAYYNRGNAKAQLGCFKKAIKDYDKTIELKPGYTMAYNNRGSVKANLKDFKGAIKDFDLAIDLNPDNAEFYNNRGLAKAGLKRLEEAIEDFDLAIDLNPDNAEFYNNRGNAKALLKQFDGAIKDYEKVRNICNKQGDVDEANRCQNLINKFKNQ